MNREEIEYHKKVIAEFDKILNRYSTRENNELHTAAFDVKQSHAVLLASLTHTEGEEETCNHIDIGTDGGGDFCKICGKRW